MPKFENAPNLNNPKLNPGETPTNAEIPFMITKKMKQQLADNGLSGEEINKLRPEDAWEIINGKKLEGQQVEWQEQNVKKLELSPEEQLKNLEAEVEAKQEEMTRLSESIEGTKSALNATREKLGLPPTDEDPPSISSLKDRMEKLKTEQEMPYSWNGIPTENIPRKVIENKEEGNVDKEKDSEREKEDENKEKPDEVFEKKREILKEIKNRIIEGSNSSRTNFLSHAEKYIDLANLSKNTANIFQEKHPEIVKLEIKTDIAKKIEGARKSFDVAIGDFKKWETFLFFNANSLEILLYSDPQSTSPEKLKEIEEATSIEKLEKIKSSVEKYFEEIDSVANRWNKSLEKLENTLADFNIDVVEFNLEAEDTSQFFQKKSDLLSYLNYEKILNEYQEVLSNTPKIKSEEYRQKNVDEKKDKSNKDNNENTEYVSYEVGTRKKKEPEDRFEFTEIKKRKI